VLGFLECFESGEYTFISSRGAVLKQGTITTAYTRHEWVMWRLPKRQKRRIRGMSSKVITSVTAAALPESPAKM
jgi:hypothetical protein